MNEVYNNHSSQRLYYHYQNPSKTRFLIISLLFSTLLTSPIFVNTMFKPKPKQPTKPKFSKSLAQNQNKKSLDHYFQKTKSSHFQIYLNSGPEQYDLGNVYATTVTINRCQEFLDSLVKGFSSVYQMDHKAFEWKDRLEGLVKIGKQVVKLIDKLKQEVKGWEEKKVKVEDLERELEEVRKRYGQLKERYDQMREQEDGKREREEIYLKVKERMERLGEKEILFGEMEKQMNEMRDENEALCKQNGQLKQKILKVEKQNSQIKVYLNKIVESSFCPRTIKQITQNIDSPNTSNKNTTISQQLQQNPSYPSAISIFQSLILSHPTLSATLCSFLPPKSLTSLFSLTKTTRFFLLHTPKVVHSCFRSIIDYKQYEISYFHRYISYFEKQMKKIPEEVVQATFYQFNILKENVGGDFMTVLNLCANMFEGKFGQQTVSVMNKTVKDYVESKEILHFVEEPKQQEMFLRIDKKLLEHFFEQRKIKKQQVMKQIQQMAQKISLAQNLYSVDSQTLQQFHEIVVRHFTILFVLAKHLFAQSRSLQYLNGFLLGELNGITKFRIEKEYDLEDIKAQLEASNKMCLFLSDKCNKSQQRILRQTKEYLETQRHVGKLAEVIKAEQQKVKKLEHQFAQKELQVSRVKEKHNELKNVYMASKEKYNKLVSELAVVKQTILNLK